MEGTDKGHENAEGMALVGVSLTVMLGRCAYALLPGLNDTLILVELMQADWMLAIL